MEGVGSSSFQRWQQCQALGRRRGTWVVLAVAGAADCETLAACHPTSPLHIILIDLSSVISVTSKPASLSRYDTVNINLPSYMCCGCLFRPPGSGYPHEQRTPLHHTAAARRSVGEDPSPEDP